MAFSPTPISRRAVATGIAWAVPAVTLASTAPAIAASAGVLDVRFYNSTGCVSKTGLGDVYMYINVQNNTSVAVTLASDVVFRVVSTNPESNHLRPSTSFGTVTCAIPGAEMVGCDSYDWTIPAGTKIPAKGEVDLLIHFLSDLQPTQLTTSTSSPLVTNKESGTATQGYTGPSGCVSYGPF